MRIKPVRFIGHKIGPFDHIELNWEQGSRYTLIVAENGLGKTTLVAAMAACLCFGDDDSFPAAHFQRFVHSEESFAYLEVNLDKTYWILRWAAQPLTGSILSQLDPYSINSDGPEDKPKYPTWNSQSGYRGPPRRRRLPPIELPHLPTLEDAALVASGPDFKIACSNRLLQTVINWYTARNIKALAAAYGVSRDLQKPEIQEQRDLSTQELKDILNPFGLIRSSEIFQWVANQYIYHALALAEDKPQEAQAYLAAIQRIEQLLSEELEYPITFQVKRNPFRLEARQDGIPLSVDQLSDGTRSLLSWPLDYLMRASRVNWADPADSALAPGLILVDEVDAHLHPEWQRRVMPAVSRLLPETFIIATTHSPFVLAATEDAQIFRIIRDKQGRLLAQASFGEMYGYPADLVLEKAFVPSLYAPHFEQKLIRLSELAGRVAAGDITAQEKQEHDALLQELAEVNPWLNSLLALSQTQGRST